MKTKNVLTIAVTKYYEFRTEANDSELAMEEYLNTSGRRLKLVEKNTEFHSFETAEEYAKSKSRSEDGRE